MFLHYRCLNLTNWTQLLLHSYRSNNSSLGNCMYKPLTIWNTHILKDRLTQTKHGKMGAEVCIVWCSTFIARHFHCTKNHTSLIMTQDITMNTHKWDLLRWSLDKLALFTAVEWTTGLIFLHQKIIYAL